LSHDANLAVVNEVTGDSDASNEAFFQRNQVLLATRAADALEVGREAEARARAADDQLGVVRALLLQGMAQDALGHAERDATLAEALRQAESLGEPVTLIRAVNSQIVVDIHRGRYADALWRGQSMLGMAHALRRNDLLLRLTMNLGTALGLIGEHELAISMFNECLGLLAGDDAGVRQQRVRIVNNMAWAWLGVARAVAEERPDGAIAALAQARQLSQQACDGALAEANGALRAGSLDTLVGVLLERGEEAEALTWVEKVERQSEAMLQPHSIAWGTCTLARCRVEVAHADVDLAAVERRLREIEAMPGSRFRTGELHASLCLCLSEVLSRLGRHQEALGYHRKWMQFEARTQSLLAREHAMAVHRTMESLWGETEEFITHDLRNPLGAALVQIDSIQPRSLDDAAQGLLDGARRHVRQAFETADHYLAIVRARNLRRASLSPMDLGELVDDVGERLAPPAGAAVRLERDIEWGLEIRGDRISLLMALDQLLRMALDATAPGGTVNWTLRAEPAYAVLTVESGAMAWTPHGAWRALAGGGAGDRRDMASAMLTRVAQLHDSRIEPVDVVADGARIEWRFPLVE
jgi:signal transduction histidine kinase